MGIAGTTAATLMADQIARELTETRDFLVGALHREGEASVALRAAERDLDRVFLPALAAAVVQADGALAGIPKTSKAYDIVLGAERARLLATPKVEPLQAKVEACADNLTRARAALASAQVNFSAAKARAAQLTAVYNLDLATLSPFYGGQRNGDGA